MEQFIFTCREARGALIHLFRDVFVHEIHDKLLSESDVARGILRHTW
jgi:hypothetical protein